MENNSTECSERAEIRTVELESSKQSLYSYFLTYSRLKKTKKSLTAQDLPQMELNNVCIHGTGTQTLGKQTGND